MSFQFLGVLKVHILKFFENLANFLPKVSFKINMQQKFRNALQTPMMLFCATFEGVSGENEKVNSLDLTFVIF